MTYPADKAVFEDAAGNIGGGLDTDNLSEGSSNLLHRCKSRFSSV